MEQFLSETDESKEGEGCEVDSVANNRIPNGLWDGKGSRSSQCFY